MKRNFISLLSLLLCGGSTFASQPSGASQPQMLIQASHGLMAPVWSPQGDKIAVTTDNYTGIYITNADGSNLQQLTNEAGAGYKMTWSTDGTQILGRTNIVENSRVLHEIKVWNVADGVSTTLLPKTRELKGTPTWKSASNILVANRSGIKTLNTKSKVLTSSNANVYEIMVNDPAGAVAQIPSLKAYANKIIINPALSPNGQKVAFQIPGNGLFVCDIDGNNLKSLGKGSHASWLPDNENIVATRVQDNGQQFTASDIYSINTTTGKTILLTGNTDIIPLTPAVSPDGKKVVFENAADASIYIINLKY